MRYSRIVCLGVTLTATIGLAWATGIVEEGPDGSTLPWEPESTSQRADDRETTADGADNARQRSALAAAPVFVPTITYPGALFLREGPSIIANVELADFLAAMEADRLLLAELRKPVPESRSEAEHYLNRLKRLAERSDPTSLAIRARRVLEQAPIYFDWLETEFETPADEVYDYYVGGAQGFSRALQEFQNAALLTALNRIDVAARVIEEAYSQEE